MVRLSLLALVVIAASGCAEEPQERDRFGGAGGTSTSAGANGGAGGSTVGAGGAGQGGSGGNASSERVCINGNLTLTDLTLTEGDTEFDGNGPTVTLSVDLTATSTSVTVDACVRMRETQSDWSTGTRCEQQTVNVANNGLLSADAFSAVYTDTDHETDNVFNEASTLNLADELVVSAQCVGDTSGEDICAATNGDCAMCLVTLGCFVVSKAP